MARELIDSWGAYQAAIDRLLPIAGEKICIYDQDLLQLRLDAPARLSQLQRLLQFGGQGLRLRIAVRDADPARRRNPRLMALLERHGHLFALQQTAPQIAHLRDAMIIIDDRFGLIRFDREQPRGKLLIDESDELRPYIARFSDLWDEGGGEMITTSVLGL